MEKWQEEYIKNNYNQYDNRTLVKKSKVTHRQLELFLRKNNLKRCKPFTGCKKWTEKELKLLIENYEYGDINWLCSQINKNYSNVKEQARAYGLKRKINIQRQCNLLPLLSGTLESYYWLGLLAADGYITNLGSISIVQSDIGKDLMDKLANFLETKSVTAKIKNPDGYIVHKVHACDNILGKKIYNMFGIQKDLPKTYTGIKLDFIKTQKQAGSFLAGFIEGDGCLRKDHETYQISCHKSWENTFQILLDKLPKKIKNVSLRLHTRSDNGKTYIHFDLRKSSSNALREFVHKHNLPVSERKFPKLL